MAKTHTSPIFLSADSHEPLWQQVAAVISEEIATGKLVAGSRLPPERDFLERLSVSRVTLRRALQSLGASGVLTASHGRGWYVAQDAKQEFPQSLESFSETAARLGLVSSSEVIRAEVLPATLDQSELFFVAPGSAIFHLERIRKLDGVPVAVDASYFPMTEGFDIAGVDFKTASLFKLMIDQGYILLRAESTIEARGAERDLAKHLKIEIGMPVLAMRQLVENSDGKPQLSSSITYAGDRYRLRTTFTRVGTTTGKS